MLAVKEIKLDDSLSWDELIKESETATFFQNKEWLRIWVKHWNRDARVAVYTVFDGGQLVGIAPFRIADKINILGAPDPSEAGSLADFGDIILKKGREKEVWEAVLKQVKSEIAKQSGNGIELNFIREESPSFGILKNLGGQVQELEVSPYIDLPKTWDEYLLTLGRHDRHEIRRKMRKIEAENVIKACDEINTDNINEFFRLMAVSSEDKGNFLSGEMRKFLTEAVSDLGERKLMNLCFLRFGSENIAAVLLLFQKNETLLYNSGFEAKFSHLSPGLILNIYAIKQAIEEGKTRFDFLRGKEKYKYDLGGKERRLYKIIL